MTMTSACVAIKQYWPTENVAEHEVISRLTTAFSNLGLSTILVDENGQRIDGNGALKKDDVLFCLDLHFKTPRVFDGVSVAALWNPLDFYSMFGASRSLANQISHDLFVAANPASASWVRSLRPDLHQEILQLNHSVPEESIRIPRSFPTGKLVYVGIGWDKRRGGPGRHNFLLKHLDMAGVLELYGPRRLASGLRPWKGFSSYLGSLPFDGTSVMDRIHVAGFALCMSSESHKSDGIQSNRLFETIAAGAIPVVEEGAASPFSLEGSIFIPSGLSAEQEGEYVASEIRKLMLEPDDFKRRVGKLQERLSSRFTLESQLDLICKEVQRFSIAPRGRIASHQDKESQLVATSLLDCLADFQNKGDEELNHADFHVLSTRAFSAFFKARVMADDASWVYMGYGKDLPKADLSVSDLKETDVVWLNGVSTSASGAFEPVNKLLHPGHLSRILFKTEILFAFMGDSASSLSIPFIAEALRADSIFTDSTLKHKQFWRIQVAFSGAKLVEARSLISNLDLVSITHIKSSDPSDWQRQLLDNVGGVINSVDYHTSGNLTADDVFRALSSLRARDLPRILITGMKSLLR